MDEQKKKWRTGKARLLLPAVAGSAVLAIGLAARWELRREDNAKFLQRAPPEEDEWSRTAGNLIIVEKENEPEHAKDEQVESRFLYPPDVTTPTAADAGNWDTDDGGIVAANLLLHTLTGALKESDAVKKLFDAQDDAPVAANLMFSGHEIDQPAIAPPPVPPGHPQKKPHRHHDVMAANLMAAPEEVKDFQGLNPDGPKILPHRGAVPGKQRQK